MSSSLVLHARVVRGRGGGPEKTILNSPRFLKPAGYRTLCAYMRHPHDFGFETIERQARHRGVRLLAIDDRGPLDLRLLRRVGEICDKYQPTIWHGHDYKSNLLGLILRRSHTMRLLTTVHGWVHRTWKTPFYYAIDRLCLRYYDGVICVSPDLLRACLRAGVTADRCWLVPNAIDIEEYSRRETVTAAKERLGIHPDRILIGAVGRLSDEKGFGKLIRAVGRLVDSGVNVELWIAGEGSRKHELERLVSKLGLATRVKLPGYQEEILDLYHAMGVFVMSSTREGLPNALLEAMALEIPVLATRVAGVPALIRDDENGLLVEPNSVNSLVVGLERLVHDDVLRRHLGRKGRQTIERSYGFPQRMDTIREIYDRTLPNEVS